jgi:hypothetical protein
MEEIHRVDPRQFHARDDLGVSLIHPQAQPGAGIRTQPLDAGSRTGDRAEIGKPHGGIPWRTLKAVLPQTMKRPQEEDESSE